VNKRLIATAAAALIAGTSATAGAQSTVAYTNNPIKVVSYALEPSYSVTVPAWTSTLSIESSGKVTISFVNAGAVPATSVQFAVRSNKVTELILDKGTFSPGANIKHDFSLDPTLGSSAEVDVEHVTFADGTVWQREH
jgi:hypothetical protein